MRVRKSELNRILLNGVPKYLARVNVAARGVPAKDQLRGEKAQVRSKGNDPNLLDVESDFVTKVGIDLLTGMKNDHPTSTCKIPASFRKWQLRKVIRNSVKHVVLAGQKKPPQKEEVFT